MAQHKAGEHFRRKGSGEIRVLGAHFFPICHTQFTTAIGREADRVDFIVNENVDMGLFTIDAYVMFTFEVREGNFIIVSAMAMSNTDSVHNDVTTDKGE